MIDYLIVILIFVILEGVMYLIDLPFKNKIKVSDSVESSLRTRKQLKITRIISTALLIIFVCVVLIIIAAQNDTIDTIGQALGLIIGYAIVKGWSMLKGNIQTYSKKEYLSKHTDNYVVYLRAFEADFYSKSPKSHSLESCLAKAIKKRRTSICAIGMTKELDAPVGADRVYVDDKTWQTDVSELMQKAKMIFILMSDRQSCIWEIAQGEKMLNKICFVIDDLEKYKNIKSDTTHNIHFPEIETLASKLNHAQSSDLATDFENHYIAFLMNDVDLEVCTFDILATPDKINKELDKITQIRRLL